MATKKHVYRVGDRIRVVNPLWVKRVGYALHWRDLVDEVEKDPRTTKALQELGFNIKFCSAPGFLGLETLANFPHYFVQAVAKLRVEQRNFGGNIRSIHYDESVPDPVSGLLYPGFSRSAGTLHWVRGKRVAKTGTRYHYFYGEDGDEGGLQDEKTHIILRTDAGEIEAVNVEPVV